MTTELKLPNLIIAGVGKAGTSSLFHLLGQHPDICASTVKEVEYFAPLRYPGGVLAPVEDYAACVAHAADEPFRMEATPHYCYGGPDLVAAVRDVCGADTRIVLSLRQPTERLWSNFTYMQARALLPHDLTFSDWVDEAMLRHATREDLLPEHRFLRPLRTSQYMSWLPDWFDAFGEHCHVVFFDDLVADSRSVAADVLRWLDLDPTPAADFADEVRNPTVASRSPGIQRLAYGLNERLGSWLRERPELVAKLRGAYQRINGTSASATLDDANRAKLDDFYRDDLNALREYLGARGTAMPAWLSTAA